MRSKIIILALISLTGCVNQPISLPGSTSSPTSNISVEPTSIPSIPSDVSVSASPTESPITSITPNPSAIPTISPTAYPLPENTNYNRNIIYSTYSASTSILELYSLNPENLETKSISTSIVGAGTPNTYIYTTPDGKNIFYIGGHYLYRINSDNYNKTSIKRGSMGALNMSRDGKFIAFAEFMSPNINIYNVETSELKTYEINKDFVIGFSSFSPDGKKIIFSSNIGTLNELNSQLFVMNIDGTDLKMITTGKSNDVYYYPQWLPDGSKIILNYADKEKQKGGIYSINPDGSGLTFITDKADGVVISPNGKHLTYTDKKSIYICDTNGNNLKKVIEFSKDKYIEINSLSWSPDSLRIAANVDFKINVFNIDGSNLKSITEKPIKMFEDHNSDMAGGIYVRSLTW